MSNVIQIILGAMTSNHAFKLIINENDDWLEKIAIMILLTHACNFLFGMKFIIARKLRPLSFPKDNKLQFSIRLSS